VGPAAADVDGAGVALVLLRQPALAAVLYPRIEAHVSLVFCKHKPMALLVWGLLLVLMEVLIVDLVPG
jgi:hypothetical protein